MKEDVCTNDAFCRFYKPKLHKIVKDPYAEQKVHVIFHKYSKYFNLDTWDVVLPNQSIK